MNQAPPSPGTQSHPGPMAIVGSVAYVLITSFGGYVCWVASLMGSDVCLAGTEPVTWACTTTGQITIGWIVPVGHLIGWTILFTARSHRKHALQRPGPAVIAATMIILGSWYLSISLAMSAGSRPQSVPVTAMSLKDVSDWTRSPTTQCELKSRVRVGVMA